MTLIEDSDSIRTSWPLVSVELEVESVMVSRIAFQELSVSVIRPFERR